MLFSMLVTMVFKERSGDMKKILSALIISAIIVFFMFTTNTSQANEEKDLLTLVSVLHDENIPIIGWSLHAREKVDSFQSEEEIEKYIKVLKEKFPNWNWKVHSDTDQWEVIATKESSGKTEEKIQILSTHTKTNPQTYILYEAKGENFNKENEQFIREELTGTLSDIFRGNTTIFSCITGEFNGKINSSLPLIVNNLLKAFQAKEIESIREQGFISTTAHSPLFAEDLTNKNKDMNLQIGMRNHGLGAKTTLVVGTPIITIEY